MAEIKKCSYNGCENEQIGINQKCILHSPQHEQVHYLDQFYKKLKEQIESGNYEFCGYNFPDHITFKDYFSNKKVDKLLDFHKAQFYGEADFTELIFKRDVHFTYATFYNKVDFDKVIFEDEADFRKVTFYKEIYCGNMTFGDRANFSNTTFKEIGNFGGATFLGEALFYKASFEEWSYFETTIFKKDAEFFNVIFYGKANFNGAAFHKEANFKNSKFEKSAKFSSASFEERVIFSEAVFFGDSYFESTTFKTDSYFIRTIFENSAKFDKAKFQSQTFDKTVFKGITSFRFAAIRANGLLSFYKTHFLDEINFQQTSISSPIRFENIQFGVTSQFKFSFPIFSGNINNVIFDTVQFPQLRTFFEHINFLEINEDSNNSISFRHCNLKNVFFTNCDLSRFSFFKSIFENAVFTSCKWGILRRKFFPSRKNILFEEALYNENNGILGETQEFLRLKDLENIIDISELYRKMKVSLDNSKDYTNAGLAYYNEWETRRLALVEDYKLERSFWRIKFGKYENARFSFLSFTKWFTSAPIRRMQYFAYKVFAGYGEKPLRSLFWFGASCVAFALHYLYSGMKIVRADGVEKAVNYDLAWNASWNAFFDFGHALFFSLQHILPRQYMTFMSTKYAANAQVSDVASFFNSIVLIIFIVFIGIGLKRHFRRF